MSLNDSQREIAETTEGLMVVDAGPGTGKTHTITERYLNIIRKEDVSPRDVLMLTFTNNAATEMEERIKSKLVENGMIENAKFVMTKTFDAFCLSVVMDSPEMVSQFFKTEHTLTRSAKMSDNQTLNNEYFCQFLDEFLDENGGSYGDWGIIAGEKPLDLLNLLNKLMALGVVPMRNGWFTDDPKNTLWGDVDRLFRDMEKANPEDSTKQTALYKAVNDKKHEFFGVPESINGKILTKETLRLAADGDRDLLIEFIHDVFYGYISKSISDNRLTFGLVAIFAFVLLYRYKNIRERNSFRYLMIDEFQDTNANQLMIAMMILNEPNLCVVGDWKQGIYGFRFVSIENITEFEPRLRRFKRFLNEDEDRVRFNISEAIPKSLNINYRSSQKIIDKAFDTLTIKGSDNEPLNEEALKKNITRITADRTELEEVSDIRYVKCADKEEEVQAVVMAIRDYITPGRYTVRDRDGDRPVRYGDIAVICRNTEPCRQVMDACEKAGIPAYLYGNVNIMSTREGKLTLAWLRYVNNEADPKGLVPIMADLGYNLNEIQKAKRDDGQHVPEDIARFRKELRDKRRRITELLTMVYRFYGLDNDITQSIITTISSAHSQSLLTISDIIRIIDEDIENDTVYPVENSIGSSSVSIMTMHKSKGLEFPIVISPMIDQSTMPSTKGDQHIFIYDSRLGIRCKKEIGTVDGYSKIYDSWRTYAANGTYHRDYSEERRLMFVTLSRAKQYETLICSKPSGFMKKLSGEDYTTIPESPENGLSEEVSVSDKPDMSFERPDVIKAPVHAIMQIYEEGTKNMAGRPDEAPGKGKDYGDHIHNLAEYIVKDYHIAKDDEKYPEVPVIREIVASLKDAKLYPEILCGLPVPDTNVILQGRIDLLAVFDDRIEIHDWKTDVGREYESEYKLQLSVYAHAAGEFYGKPVRCVIDYVSRRETETFDPLPMNNIQERVRKHISQQNGDS